MRIVVMGVSGSGKTTVGAALARTLGVPFLDADDFHPPENIAKMSAGVPLDDADRQPWLEALNHGLGSHPSVVIACSALKNRYRETLTAGLDVKFVWLKVDEETVRRRFSERAGHFMNAELIGSQFEALEPPADAICIDGSWPLSEIVDRVANAVAYEANHLR